jgi:hypothetical protein
VRSALAGGRVKRAQRKPGTASEAAPKEEQKADSGKDGQTVQTKRFEERTNVYKSVIGGSKKYNRSTKERAALERQKSATATDEEAADQPVLPTGPPKKKAPGGRAPKLGVRDTPRSLLHGWRAKV